MQLLPSRLKEYEENGLLLFPSALGPDVIEPLRAEVPAIASAEAESRVLEANSEAVRAVHGCHLTNDLMKKITRHPSLLIPAMQLLQGDVYVYQFKINLKAGFEGQPWPWHQDFKHWQEEDGLRAPSAVNVALFLSDINTFNGPLFLVPGSHKSGNLCNVERETSGWSAKYRADVEYILNQTTVRRLVEERGIVSAEGPKGSLLFFDVNLVHASCANISPFDRWLLIITYNRIDNPPRYRRPERPEFLVGRDFEPLTPLEWSRS